MFPISLSISTLFQIMQVSNGSWNSLILGLAQRCSSEDEPYVLSEEEIFSIL
jgi:hypothetical protein